MGLAVDEQTIGKTLQKLGYTTMAVGKWHMGEQEQFFPLNRGFDEFFGMKGGSRSYFPYEGKCGAGQVIIVSASSKTSIGLAYALDDDTTAPPTVAITSARNLDFVKGLGLYEESVTYDSLTDIDATIPAVIVDMSGNGEVLGRLHTHLGDNMVRCINVGLTHWDEGLAGDGIIKERSEFFFAPTHIQKRMQDWGPDGFAQKTSSFMQETALKSRAWLELKRIDGLQGLADVYEDVCRGRLSPAEGLIIEL